MHVRVSDFVKFQSIHFNFRVPESYAYLSGTWKMKMAKPKVEGTPTVGLILKKRVCTGGILLYQFTNFLYLAESKL